MRPNPVHPVITVVSIFAFFIGLWLFLFGFGGNVLILAVGAAVLVVGVWSLVRTLGGRHPGAPAT